MSNDLDEEDQRLQKRTRFLLHAVLAGLLLTVSLVLITGLDNKINASPEVPSTSSEGFDGRWQLNDQFLELQADGVVVGSDGCNNLRSQWTQLGENEISFSPFSSTKKACPGDNNDRLLGEATKGSLDESGDKLRLYDMRGEVLTILSTGDSE